MESRLELVVSSQAAEQHISRLQRELERLDGRGSAATAMMGKMSLAIGAISAAAGGLGFSRIIRETASFEDAMLGLQAVSGATAAQMSELEKQARTLGATSMFSAEQAGNAQRYLAMAGLEVNEVLSATPGILKLATAGQLDLATAADIASNVLGGMSMEVSELSRVNDVLAATASGANTDIRQLGEALSYAAPFASKAGLSLEETAAAIGAMSDAGIQSSRAGTGLVGILAQLADATPKAQAAIEGANLSMAQLDIKARGLQPVLDDLRGANLGLGEALQIFGREAGAAALNVINASAGVAEFTEELREAEGAADEMSLIIGGGLTGSMKGFASMLSETIIGLGRDDGLAAGFQSVTDTATGMLAVYNGMLPAFAEANNLTEAQTDRIEALAAGVDMLGDVAIIAAGLYTGRFVSAMAAGAVSIANKTKASIADARADAASAAATVRRTAAEKQTALALLSTTRLEVQATKGTSAHAFALQQLSVARTRAATAAGAHTAAMNAATAATARASVAARGLSTALSLVGGPLGLLVGAGGLLYVFRDELNLTGQRAGLTEDQIRDLRDEMKDMSQDDLSQSLSSLNAALDAATIKAATAREELAQLRSENRGSGALGFGGGELGAEVSGMQAVAEAQERIAELNDKINVARGETARRIEQNANAFVVYADRIEEAGEETKLADEFTKTLSASTTDAADKTYTLADAYESLLDRITPNRREARQYAQDLGVLNLALASGRMNTQEYMQAMGMLQESFQAAQRETDDLSKKVTDGTETMSREFERFGNTFDDTMVNMIMGATDGFDTIERAGKRMFAELLWAASKNEIRVRLGMQTSGPLQGGFSQLLGMGKSDGLGSLISGGKTLLGLSAPAAATGTALSGGFMGAAATQSAGSLYGMAATGGVAQAGLASSIAAGISTAMPWIAGGLAIDSLLGGGITKAISGLFGGKSRGPSFDLMTTNQDPRTIFEDVQHGVTATGAFGNVGFHGGNTNRLEETFGSFDNARQYLETIAATDDMMAALSPKDVEAMTYAIQQMRIQSNDAAGITEQLGNRTKAAFGAMSGDFGAFARTLTGSTEEIIAQAQTTQQAHALLTSASERLGLQFNIAGGYAYEAAQDIAQLAGGVENLSALQQSYYQNFFTEAERAAHLTADLTSALGSMGLQLPETREGFRQLVEAQDLSTESGRQAYAQLLQLSASFSELTPEIQAASSAVSEAQRTYQQLKTQELRLLGDTEALRQLEIDALREIPGAEEEGVIALQKRIWALEDAEAAEDKAAEASERRRRKMEQQAAAMDRAREQLASLGVSIDSWIDNLRGTDAGLGTPGDQLAAASAAFDEQYAKALSGDQAALGSITQYADRFIEAQKGWSASGEQTVSTIDRVTGMLERLPDQLTPEQFIVDGFRDVILNELADEIERAIMDSKYTISTLIDFATNTDQLPADLRAILGEQSHRLDSTLNYLVGENQLTSDLERLAIDSTNNLVATVEYITFSPLEEDDKRLALSSSNTMTAVVDYAVRSDLDNASRRLALESSNVYGVMIEYAIERDISKDDRTLALDSINRYTAVVEYVTRSELTASNRHLALGSLNEYDAIIDYATRNDIAGADRTLAVEKGNWYLANVDYIVGKTLTAENRRLALQSNHNYISVIDQVLGMQLGGDDRRLALQSGNTYETIVDAVLADGISPDVRKFALSKSNSLLATVDGILESGLSDDVRTLALEDSNHFVTTLEAALADGKLSRDERALLDAQSDTIFKRLETGGLKLTDDEWAVINAASGTRRLDLLADVAFNATDLDKLGDIEKNTGDAIDPNTEGMKISIGRHHNPSGLIDMAYNWGTKWADMGAPAFSGSGGGGLDYSPSNGGSSSGSIGGGSNSSTEQLSLNERARLYYQRYPDLQRYYQSNADSFHKKYGGSTYIDFAKWHWLDGPGQTDAIDRYFAKGGVFTNSIVDSPTPFNMGLMGEAGPEAIVPLHMGAEGLGIKNYSAPPLPQFPLLSTQDVTQVMRDMQRTIEQKNEQIVELLKEVRGNTGQTRDAVMGVGKGAHQQREQQSRQLDRLNRNTKEKVRTP